MASHVSRTLLVLAALTPALAAQAVTTVLKGTTLTIKGSAGIDDLTLGNPGAVADGDQVPAPVDVLVTPNNGTTLNGSPDPVTFPGVLKLKILLGDGSDVVHLTDFAFGVDPVTLNAGPGDDHVFLVNTTTGPFKFIGAAGNDTFDLNGSHLESTKVIGSSGVLTMPAVSSYMHDLKLTAGPEIDALDWTSTTVDFSAKLNLSAGNDHVHWNDIIVGNDATLLLGPGNDDFADDAGTFGNFVSIVASSGDDHVVFEDSLVGNDLNLKLGSGQNEVEMRGQDEEFSVGNTCTITGGGAIDTVKCVDFGHAVIFGNNLVCALKAGANELQSNGDVSTGDDLRYTGGGGDDVVDLDGFQVGTDANIVLKGGTNDVILTDCEVGNDLRITAGSGDDTVQFLGTTAASIGGNVLIHLGGGFNISP